MPRHPRGDQAMTGAERQRLWRERLRQERGPQSPAAIIDALRKDNADLRRQLPALKKRIADLEAEVARLRAPPAESKERQQAHGAQTKSPPKPQTIDEEAMAVRMRADLDRERAQWGGRPKSLVIDNIGRLFASRGVRLDELDDHTSETIINTMLPHVRDQDNIEKGISRKTYRKVLADLHVDRNPTGVTAFIAFKALDVRKDDKPNRNTIVIADDKVRMMADYWRKREERSERAAVKRKAARDAKAKQEHKR